MTSSVTVTEGADGLHYYRSQGGEIAGPTESQRLGIVAHNPTTSTVYSTASGTLVDVDPVNLALRVTVPASGRILVSLQGSALVGTVGQWGAWGVRDQSGILAGPARVTISTEVDARSKSFPIAGLTPGSSVELRWAHCNATAIPIGNVATYAGGTTADFPAGAAVMTVWALP